MVWISKWDRRSNHLKSGQMAAVLKSRQKCLDFEWSSSPMVGTIALAQPLEKPDHLKSSLQKVQILNFQISDPHCTTLLIVFAFG